MSWVLFAYDMQGFAAYGTKTSNLVEQENSRIRGIRAKAPETAIRGLVHLQQSIAYSCETDAIKHVKKGMTLTAYAQKKYEEQGKFAARADVTPSGLGIGAATSRDVQPYLGIVREHHVNIAEKKCDCLFWQQHGIPCRHAIKFFKAQLHSAGVDDPWTSGRWLG